jgi:hypothetical protein
MSTDGARPVVTTGGEAVWFLGTFVRVKLDGRHTDGRLGAISWSAMHA